MNKSQWNKATEAEKARYILGQQLKLKTVPFILADSKVGDNEGDCGVAYMFQAGIVQLNIPDVSLSAAAKHTEDTLKYWRDKLKVPNNETSAGR